MKKCISGLKSVGKQIAKNFRSEKLILTDDACDGEHPQEYPVKHHGHVFPVVRELEAKREPKWWPQSVFPVWLFFAYAFEVVLVLDVLSNEFDCVDGALDGRVEGSGGIRVFRDPVHVGIKSNV